MLIPCPAITRPVAQAQSDFLTHCPELRPVETTDKRFGGHPKGAHQKMQGCREWPPISMNHSLLWAEARIGNRKEFREPRSPDSLWSHRIRKGVLDYHRLR